MGSALFSPGTFPIHFCNMYLTLIISRSKTQKKSIKAQRVSLCPTDSKDIHSFPKSSTYANNDACDAGVHVCAACVLVGVCVDVRR